MIYPKAHGLSFHLMLSTMSEAYVLHIDTYIYISKYIYLCCIWNSATGCCCKINMTRTATNPSVLSTDLPSPPLLSTLPSFRLGEYSLLSFRHSLIYTPNYISQYVLHIKYIYVKLQLFIHIKYSQQKYVLIRTSLIYPTPQALEWKLFLTLLQ